MTQYLKKSRLQSHVLSDILKKSGDDTSIVTKNGLTVGDEPGTRGLYHEL